MKNKNNIDLEPKIAREPEIDILKGIAIIFVIIGHMGKSEIGGGSILSYAYSFHMGLFFIVSGYLSYNKADKGFVNYFKGKTKSILVPYAGFYIFSFIWTNTIYATTHGAQMFSFPYTTANMLKAFFLSSSYLEQVPINNFPLWFLPLSFIASILFYFILKIKNNKLLIISTIFIAIITIPIQTALPGRPVLSINVLPAALFYILAGYLFHCYKEKWNLCRFNNSFLAILLLVAGYAISLKFNGSVSQINTYVYFVGSLISIYGYYMLACESDNKILKYMGQNSLYMFALHSHIILQNALGIDQYFITRGQDGVMVYTIQILSITMVTIALTAVIKVFEMLVKKTVTYINVSYCKST